MAESTKETRADVWEIGGLLGMHVSTSVVKTSRPGGTIVRQAGCVCGAKYEWAERESQHEQHRLEVIADYARERVDKALADVETRMLRSEALIEGHYASTAARVVAVARVHGGY